MPVMSDEFTVLGHWASAGAAPQWLEWDFSLRPGMGIGRVQALMFPAMDGDVKVPHAICALFSNFFLIFGGVLTTTGVKRIDSINLWLMGQLRRHGNALST